MDRDLTTNSREPRRNLVRVPLWYPGKYHRPKTFRSRNKFRIVFRGNVSSCSMTISSGHPSFFARLTAKPVNLGLKETAEDEILKKEHILLLTFHGSECLTTVELFFNVKSCIKWDITGDLSGKFV